MSEQECKPSNELLGRSEVVRRSATLDISWGADCAVCETRLSAGRAAECLGDDGSVVCGSCRDEERAAKVRDALRELVALKDGPRNDDYKRRKSLVWQAAREALADA